MGLLIKGDSSFKAGNGFYNQPIAKGQIRQFSCVAGSANYDTFTDELGVAYSVPANKVLVVLAVCGVSTAAAANNFDIGSGTASVSNAAGAPAGSAYSGKAAFFAPFGALAVPQQVATFFRIATGRYPYVKATTNAGVTIQVSIIAIEIDA